MTSVGNVAAFEQHPPLVVGLLLLTTPLAARVRGMMSVGNMMHAL